MWNISRDSEWERGRLHLTEGSKPGWASMFTCETRAGPRRSHQAEGKRKWDPKHFQEGAWDSICSIPL